MHLEISEEGFEFRDPDVRPNFCRSFLQLNPGLHFQKLGSSHFQSPKCGLNGVGASANQRPGFV